MLLIRLSFDTTCQKRYNGYEVIKIKTDLQSDINTTANALPRVH